MARMGTTRFVMYLAAIMLLTAALAGPAVAETVKVTPKTMAAAGWQVAVQEAGDDIMGYEFASGYGTPPAGSGSFHLWVGYCCADPLPKVYLGTNAFNGVRLDKVTQLRLSVCPRAYDYAGAQPVTVEIAATKDTNLRLFTFYPWGYKPAGYYGRSQWRECDLMSSQAAWEFTNTDSPDNRGNWAWLVNRCPGARIVTPRAADWPNGTLSGTGVNIKVGAGRASERRHGAWWQESSGCNAYVDKLTVAYLDDAGQEIVKTYDFEPE